jgi:hypothetical protein
MAIERSARELSPNLRTHTVWCSTGRNENKYIWIRMLRNAKFQFISN